MRSSLKFVLVGGSVLAVMGVLLLVSLQGKRAGTGSQPERQRVHTLRFGHNISEDSAMHAAAVQFSSLVRQRSNGRLLLEVFPNQALGNDHQMVEMARNGKLDIVLTPTAKLSTLVPAMQYADLPFLFPSREDAYALLDGEVGDLLLGQLSTQGLIGVTFWENGFKHFTANKPIHGPEDFTGLNIRVMESPMLFDQFKAFGANPIPIDFHQTYQALKDGVVVGQENPLVAIHNMRFHEVQSHLILSRHAYLCYVLSFSKKTYALLPPDLQEILSATARELTAFERSETQAREETFLENIAKSGTKIISLTEEEAARFRESTAHIVEKYRQIIGEEILARTEEYLDEKYPQRQEAAFVIGLNADMSLASSRTGLAIKRGMEMAVAEINGAGGLLGMPVRILVMDHAGIPARARQNVNKFKAIPNLLAVVGGQRSTVSLAILELIRESKMVYLVPWSPAREIVESDAQHDYVFRIAAQDEIVGALLLKKALALSPSIGLLLENTSWGGSIRNGLSAALAERGMKPCAVEFFAKEERMMIPQLQRLLQAGAGVILLAAEDREAATAVRDLAQLSGRVPLFLHGGAIGPELQKTLSQQNSGPALHFVQTFAAPSNRSSKKQEFIAQYRRRYHGEASENDLMLDPAAHAYDLVSLLARGVKSSGEPAADAIVRALEQIPRHEGAVKLYAPAFTSRRHDALGEENLELVIFNKVSHGAGSKDSVVRGTP